MALTANTILAMAPWGGQAGTQAGGVLHFTSSAALAEGDVLIMTSGKMVEDNSAPAADTVVGVALHDVAAADTDVAVALALPGRIFEANVVTNSTTDETAGVFADNIGVEIGIVESTSADAGKAVLDLSNTTQNICRTLFYAKQRNTTQDADRLTAGVGVVNPRVCFVFNTSIFCVIA